MIVGFCWPTPGTQESGYWGELMDKMKENTRATHIRTNFDHRRTDSILGHVMNIRDHGFEVLPILDFDYERPANGPYADFCAAVSRDCNFSYVELGNEPHTLHRMDSMRYAEVFNAGAHAIRDAGLSTKILIASESTQPIAKPIGYWDQVRHIVPTELYDGIAIHPYRNPQPPRYTRFGTREAEFAYYRSTAPGKEVHVTEFGWDLRGGVNEAIQAGYIYEELTIQEQMGAASAYVYTVTEAKPPNDQLFGLTDYQYHVKPACHAIARFQEERGL